MKNWTVRKRIIFGFALLLSLVAVQTAITLVLLRKVKAEAHVIATDALPGTLLAAKVKANVSNIQILVLRVLLAKTHEERKVYEDDIASRKAANDEALAAYEKLVQEPEESTLHENTKKVRASYTEARLRIVELAGQGKVEEGIAYNASTGRFT